MKEEANDMKAQYYKDRNRPIHVELKNSVFYNGFITEISSDFLLIKDRKLGELPIFFLEIKKIEPEREKKEGKGGRNKD